MKLRSPIHSIDARGRFADALVLGIWRGINWARKFVKPTNPQTVHQDVVRKILIATTRSWATLTPDQRTNWEAFAFYIGNPDPLSANEVRMTGIAAYTWVNTVLSDTGYPRVVDPPALPLPMELPGFAVAPGPIPGEVTVTWTPQPVGALVDFWSQVIPPTRKALPRRYKHDLYLDGALGTFTYTGKKSSWKMSARGRLIRPDGGRSPYSRGEIIVP